ncbi:cleavage induced hypothetical protein [Thraustotheca clavata]|uniref:FYVE-type domain-containing protein n=1 Tax=Thraustotheca clavata TaxID=74557 RepID=A0A1V9ZQG0_9STRA|nr:cleavage induced hypothetical protein [Thraustotheca clavata]
MEAAFLRHQTSSTLTHPTSMLHPPHLLTGIAATPVSMFPIVEKKFKIQVNDEMERKLRQIGQSRAMTLAADVHQVPLRESNGVALYEIADDAYYTMKGSVLIPSSSVADVMAFLAMPTTDRFRYIFGELFGSLFVEGSVLYASNVKTPDENLSINWMALHNAKHNVPYRDYVYLKYSSRIENNGKKFSHPYEERVGVQIWESLELDSCPPLPDSLHVDRHKFRRCGFVVARDTSRNSVRVSLFLSELQATDVSHLTQNWLSNMLVCLSRFSHVLVSHHLSLMPLVTSFAESDADCEGCRKPRGKSRSFCFVCQKPYCAKCLESRSVRFKGAKLDARVCNRCITVAMRAPAKPPGTIEPEPEADKKKSFRRPRFGPEDIIRWRDTGRTRISQVIELLSLDYEFAGASEINPEILFHESVPGARTFRASVTVPSSRYSVAQILDNLHFADSEHMRHVMTHVYGTIFTSGVVLYSMSLAKLGPHERLEIVEMGSKDGARLRLLRYANLVDYNGTKVGVCISESLTSEVQWTNMGYVIENAEDGIRISLFITDDKGHWIAPVTQQLQLDKLASDFQFAATCDHCRRKNPPPETPPESPQVSPAFAPLPDPSIPPPPPLPEPISLNSVVESSLLALGHMRADSLLTTASEPMEFVCEVNGIGIYEATVNDLYRVKSVLLVPCVSLSDVEEVLSMNTTQAFELTLRHLFGGLHVVEGEVLFANSTVLNPNSNLQVHSMVLNNDIEYLFIQCRKTTITENDETKIAIVWESIELDDYPVEAPRRRHSFHHCGFILEETTVQENQAVQVSWIMSQPQLNEENDKEEVLEHGLPIDWKVVLSNASERLWTDAVIDHRLTEVAPVAAPPNDPAATSCAACKQTFGRTMTNRQFCVVCGDAVCLNCSCTRQLFPGSSSVCNGCLNTHTTQLLRRSSFTSTTTSESPVLPVAPRQQLYIPMSRTNSQSENRAQKKLNITPERLQSLSKLGLKCAKELCSNMKTVPLKDAANGVQLFEVDDGSVYTIKATITLSKVQSHDLLTMLNMPTTKHLLYFFDELFQQHFVDGKVLFSQDNLSILWLLFQSARAHLPQREYVLLKAQHTLGTTAVSVWESVDFNVDDLVRRATAPPAALGAIVPEVTYNIVRLNLHRSGFVLQDIQGGTPACRISFFLSENHQQRPRVSSTTKHWLTAMVAMISDLHTVFAGYQLSHLPLLSLNDLSNSTPTKCPDCYKAFSLVRVRHTCRLCGNSVCSKCSETKRLIFVKDPVRVCHRCIKGAVNTGPIKATVIRDLIASPELNRTPYVSRSNSQIGMPMIEDAPQVFKRPSRVHISADFAAGLRQRGQLLVTELLSMNAPMAPVKEVNGVHISEIESNDCFVVKGSLLLPNYSITDILTLLEMPVTDYFNTTMEDIFGQLYRHGSVLYGDTGNQDSLTINWMEMLNAKPHLPHRDFVFFKYGTLRDRFHCAPDVERTCGVSIWESLELPEACPPAPLSSNTVRVTFQHCGFVIEKELEGQNLHLSFAMTEPLNGRKTVSSNTRLWMHKMVAQISELSSALVTRYLSECNLLTHFSKAGPLCVICAKSFSILRRKTNCCVCGDEVCHKCSEVRRVRSAGSKTSREVRVCILCLAPTKVALTRIVPDPTPAKDCVVID